MKKPLFNKVCIVGVGLIGGSLGLAIKKRKLARWVIGVSRRDSTLKEAVAFKAIDMGTKDLKDAVLGADLVLLCGPISAIANQLQVLPKYLSKKTIVADVGSTKAEICSTAKKHLKLNAFVGCHPMAGSEKKGVAHADANLFVGSVCFATSKNKSIEGFWKALGAQPILVSPKEHDRVVAQNSHTPHAISFSLFQNPKRVFPGAPINPSLRDLRRLAQSDAELWADIFLSNRSEVLQSILDFEENGIRVFKNLLKAKNRAGLARFIQKANFNAK